jgi:hypothetical protein
MVRKYFEKQQINIGGLDNNDRSRILFNRYILGVIDIETFNDTLDFINEKETNHKHYQDIGYF